MGSGLSDRCRGSLLGTALGDALGAPFEGVPRPEQAAVRRWAQAEEPLTWTDDTALSLALAEYLTTAPRGVVEPDRLVSVLAQAWHREPWRGYGAGPPRIFAAHLAGRPWRDGALSLFGPQGSFGNGGAMRVAPAALVARDHAEADELARISASVTHAHVLGQDGAAVQAAAVHRALHDADDPLDRSAFLDAVFSSARTVEFQQALELLETLDPAVQPQQMASLLGNGIEALHSVPTAIAAFLSAPDSAAEAILTAVRCGGDTDTIAAMTGAISGARCGEQALEHAWLERLEGADAIRRLATSLAKAAVGPAVPGADPAG